MKFNFKGSNHSVETRDIIMSYDYIDCFPAVGVVLHTTIDGIDSDKFNIMLFLNEETDDITIEIEDRHDDEYFIIDPELDDAEREIVINKLGC